jgi:UDP-N-acetylglucosamine--N-acetylmuramyl-(pentapeptide) pyrophosphoryl-undecaprenol N-acetylglucosamine transferase
VVPALAIADELRASGADVSFVGTRDRIEAELVPAAGYEISFLRVRALHRRNPLLALPAAVRAARATVQARRILRTAGADAVLGAGGYVAGPVGLAAVLRRTPLVLTEADSKVGLANRMLAPFARRICLAFPIAGRDSDRYLVTGRPVQQAILLAKRGDARAKLGIEADAPCLLVFGGSQGARSINLSAFEAFAKRPVSVGERQLAILHVAGRRDYPELRSRAEQESPAPGYRLIEYLPDLGDPLAASDVVLARAGGSVFELVAAGRPALLVPYPHASANHQANNARWMADAGAALVIEDSELDPARLAKEVSELLGDWGRLAAMSAAARSLARPRAAAQVAAEVLSAVSSR